MCAAKTVIALGNGRDKEVDALPGSRLPVGIATMTPTDPTPRQSRSESFRAFSIILFSVALLFLMLGWADGVRHDKTYLHIPGTGGFLIATAACAALAVLFLIWSRSGRR